MQVRHLFLLLAQLRLLFRSAVQSFCYEFYWQSCAHSTQLQLVLLVRCCAMLRCALLCQLCSVSCVRQHYQWLQVYAPEAMEPLLKCIHAVSSSSSIILFAKYKRFAPATKRFWELLPQFFGFEKIPETSYGSSAQEDAIGIFRLTHKQKVADAA